jgi:16S rRNA (adenine(1408)-N(1))-methyltransferase
MGTGDGLFAYHWARADPEQFFIGIDANRRPLEKISEKIYRKPSKGGLRNLLFVQSAVENLPSELDGIAGALHVNFPWGSLLAAVAGAKDAALKNLRRVCAVGATLRVVLAIDVERDAAEIKRLQLPALSVDYIDSTLVARYRESGFQIVQARALSFAEMADLQTSWAKRLRPNAARAVYSVSARAL